MATMMQKAAVCPVRASRRGCLVVCQATERHVASRRAMLGISLLPALLYAPKALALIPDEEDEDLVEKAKANRRARLAQQRGVTRDFMTSENLKDVRLEQELVPVQKAVYKLAKSGSQLESGDLKGAANTLSEDWVAEFTSVASTVSGTDAAGKLSSAIQGVQTAAASGDAAASKRQFVSLVSDLQSWASTTGLASSLKGL
ncbi:hypothetical protein VOLCADRAFT_120179 [Volvox carteri f. nagariensis]|uniref:Maintenance of Photosystem II under High light 2 C-terminal domain-containing protein n=1 Tax=Volvox carteri f. nagariensis TaxID=3068 RepID=D8THL7_VOLCA|nr:uncharacterized protein VOLCADRAFT_120179 [Volvox carteri f. nagariensis]EFJ52733.1 hypothetical protein VOLCADRAFT_120179 [Volvox carteri f. nagariensis]|eukprot:XP_002945738.1 hypothetical protein VOLCADRAFT_120179 [Volvox carteri f. nagariensis]